MTHDRYGVIKVKNSDPEQFLIGWLSSDLPKGCFMKTSGSLTEVQLRTELKKMGRTNAEADSLIERARANPW
jgi:hypothetical protein